MYSSSSLIGVVACGQLLIALTMAWTLVLMNDFKVPLVLRTVKVPRDFVRAHLDYLLMALFLFVFFLFYRMSNMPLTSLKAAAVCWGSTVNPLGFLIPSFYPAADNQPRYYPYKLLLYSGFVCTTFGFLGVAYDVFTWCTY